MGGGGGFGGAGQRGYRAEDFQGFGQEADLGDIFEGLFGGGGPAGARARGGAGAGRFNRPPPQRGANIQYRLKVPFVDAATRADQRITLSDGKTIDLKLPPGTRDGTQMRLSGKGQPGPGGAGDGLVTIEVQPHPFFRQDGDDVRLDLPVTLDEALTGAKIKVPTVDGPVMLTIKPTTSGGTTMRLKGKGFSKKSGGRGDQLVTIEIDLPEGDDDLASRLDGWRDTRPVRGAFGL
jgi:DnaJ-class molecular chaperone